MPSKMDRTYIVEAIKAAEAKLPDNHRAILISCPVDQPGARINYSAGVNREDAIGILKSLLFQWGEKENWMEHIK